MLRSPSILCAACTHGTEREELGLRKAPRPSTAPGTLVTAAELATRFARASAADLQEILDTLVALGRARAVGEGFGL
jgi:hypothetical protein